MRPVRGELLEEYLEDAFRDYRPPRFFLNDITRYWRTLGVDFAAEVLLDGVHRGYRLLMKRMA